MNIIDLKFYQDQNKWKHRIFPIEGSKNETDRVEDLIIYENQYVLIEKLNVLLGKQDCRYISERCLSSYTNQDVLINHIQKCGQQEITSENLNKESRLYRKDHFHKNPINFRSFADSKADNEIDNSNIGNKTTNIYGQNPIFKGCYIVSEMNDNVKTGYYESHLGYNNEDWYVDEVIKLEKELAFCFRNTYKDIIMTQEDKEILIIRIFVDFVKKN